MISMVLGLVAAAGVQDVPFRLARDAGGRFPAVAELDDRSLRLQGAGLCEWGLFGIDLYHAALYVDETTRSADELLAAGRPMVIHLEFARELSKDQLVEAYTASAKVNAGADFAVHEPALRAFNEGLKKVGEGDTYTFDLVPGKGVRVLRNGRPAYRVADEGFRRLLVRLYLGPKPPTPELRRGLLGEAR